MNKTFPLRTCLTVTTGRLLTKRKSENDNGISDLYEILEHITGEAPYTHALGRFSEECKPYLLKWFPELNQADVSELDKMRKEGGLVEDWLNRCIYEWNMKTEYSIGQIPKEAHQAKDPIIELGEMMRGNQS